MSSTTNTQTNTNTKLSEKTSTESSLSPEEVKKSTLQTESDSVISESKTLIEKTASIAPVDPEDTTKNGETSNTYIFFATSIISLFCFVAGINYYMSDDKQTGIIFFIFFLLTFIYVLLSLYLTFGYDTNKITEKLQSPIAAQVNSYYYKTSEYINSIIPFSSLQGGNNPSAKLFPASGAFLKVYTFYLSMFGLVFCIYLTSYYMLKKDHKSAGIFLFVSMLIIGYTYLSIMYDGSLEALRERKRIRLITGKVDLSQGSKSTALDKLIKFTVGRSNPEHAINTGTIQPFVSYTIIFIMGVSMTFYYMSQKQQDLVIMGIIIATIGAILMYYCIAANYYE